MKRFATTASVYGIINRTVRFVHFADIPFYLFVRMKYKSVGGSTTTLKRHLQAKHKNKLVNSDSTDQLDNFFSKPTTIPQDLEAEFRNCIVQWIVCDDQPFTAIENEKLANAFRILKRDIYLPTADTIKKQIINFFWQERDIVKEMLQVSYSKLNTII